MNRPPSIPQNYLLYKGTWCHPSRVPQAMRLVTQCINDDAPQLRQNATQSDSVATEGIKTPKRIRQSTKPLLNKLEDEWLAFYEKWFDRIYAQGIRFKLANGLWYKPDFVCFTVKTCWEIKGPHAFRGGFENLKVAASQYPDFKWVLTWKQDGGWKEQVVLP